MQQDSNKDRNIQNAREQVARLAREMEGLADAGGPPDTFFPEFLKRLVQVLGAEAGAIWLRDGQRRIVLTCDYRLSDIGFFDGQNSGRNDKILGDVLETGQASIRTHEDKEFPPPTPHVLLLASLHKGKDCVGVVEVFQRPDSPRDARPGYLQFMEQMCGHASRYLGNQESAKTQIAPLEFWKQFERFLLQLQRGLDVNEISHTAANDGRQLIQCDRVSVAIRYGQRTKITALSGSDSINRRANLVRLMERMSEKIIAAGEPLLFTGQLDQFPPQIEAPLAEYVHESGSRLVFVLPLLETEQLIKPKDDDREGIRQEIQRRAFGALIVEQVSESRPKPGLQDRAALVAEHSGAALYNARTHEQLFLLPVWRYLGRVLERIRGKTLHKVLAGAGALLLVTLILTFFPWEYRVEAKGRLMPVIQRNIFATWEGEVVDVLATSGERVKAEQVLVKLRNAELQAKLLAAKNEQNEKEQLRFALEAQLAEVIKNAKRDEEVQLQGKIKQAEIEIEGAKEQVSLLEEQMSQLWLRSPMNGVVATFQPEQLLRNRPVQRGEVLLEVMDDTGPWHLEVEIPENRMGHVLRQQEKKKGQNLPVEFLLATTTETTYQGTLVHTATRAVITEEEGSVVEAYIDIDPADLEKLKDSMRIGADVRAKISCGKRALGFVLFGDVIEFIEKRVLLW